MLYEGIEIAVTRKRIRSIRLSVKPDGRVTLSVPLLTLDSTILSFLDTNRRWLFRTVEKTQQRLAKQVKLRYDTGEQHLLWGQLLPLRIEPEHGRESVAFYPDEIVLYCHPDRTPEQRKKILYQGYYTQFRPVLDEMMQRWSDRLNEHDIEVSIRLMKTEWGSCMPRKRHMTFNVDLARLPRECMEYVVIHEYTHLDYCDHSPAFWRLCDERLLASGLADSKTQRALIKQIIRTCGGD